MKSVSPQVVVSALVHSRNDLDTEIGKMALPILQSTLTQAIKRIRSADSCIASLEESLKALRK